MTQSRSISVIMRRSWCGSCGNIWGDKESEQRMLLAFVLDVLVRKHFCEPHKHSLYLDDSHYYPSNKTPASISASIRSPE